MRWTLEARAKINLTLYVLGKRPDGYHDLELIFQPVSLADELTVEENNRDCLVFSCSVPAFANEENLVCRGFAAMRERFPGKIPGLTVHLQKNIPSGAGMGGGSTDCSVLLAWLYDRYIIGRESDALRIRPEDLPFTAWDNPDRDELIRIGAALGADVPACMIPHAALGRGIGEQLTDIRTEMRAPLLLIKPDVSFSTGEMYRRVDAIPYDPSGNRNPQMIRALEGNSISEAAENLYNVFEQAIPEPERIASLCAKLKEAGALGSRMTGSGSVVYGIFADEMSRDRAFLALRNLPGCRLYRCETVNE